MSYRKLLRHWPARVRGGWPYVLFLALTTLASPRASHAEVTAMLADGQTLRSITAIKPGETPEHILVEHADQQATNVAVRDLLALDFGKLSPQVVRPTVGLVNGDQVYGKLSFPNSRQVKISAGWGSITAPLEWCRFLRLHEQAPVPDPVTTDTLILESDQVAGGVQGIQDGKVRITLGGNAVPIDLARIRAVALANPTPDANPTGLMVNVDLGGGERLTGQWVKMTEDVLSLRMPWGAAVDLPVASISRLDVRNGKLIYLSDLQPTEARHTPYLDGHFPYQIDRSVSGRPLRIGGRQFSRGLGTHSRTELTYALDGGYQTFAATLGIDDSVGARGSVVYRVYGDNRMLFESPAIRGGDPAMEIKVEVKGVLFLRLEVDYAEQGDVADHANWAEARLLRN